MNQIRYNVREEDNLPPFRTYRTLSLSSGVRKVTECTLYRITCAFRTVMSLKTFISCKYRSEGQNVISIIGCVIKTITYTQVGLSSKSVIGKLVQTKNPTQIDVERSSTFPYKVIVLSFSPYVMQQREKKPTQI